MYEKLVKRLRDISNSDSNIKSNHIGLTMLQTADAIEELSRIERDFRQYISDQVKREKGVYACSYCKKRTAFDDDYSCGCVHTECDGANEWEYGTPRKRGDGK